MIQCYMSFKILNSGIFTTLQDQGRKGYQHLGITQSGAMDEYAYLWSHKLLDNKECNALEVMVGLKLEVQTSTTISVCGADLNFKINGVSQSIWQTHNIKKGDIPFRRFKQRVFSDRKIEIACCFHRICTDGSLHKVLQEKRQAKCH